MFTFGYKVERLEPKNFLFIFGKMNLLVSYLSFTYVCDWKLDKKINFCLNREVYY